MIPFGFQSFSASYRDKSELAELIRQAFDGLEKLLGPMNSTTLLALMDYAEVLHKIGQHETSDALLKEAWKYSNKVLGPQHRCTLQILERRGFMSYLLGNLKEADGLLSQALSGFKKTSGLDQLDAMICISLNAKCKEAQGLYDEAIEYHQNASDGFARILGFGNPNFIHHFSKSEQLCTRN